MTTFNIVTKPHSSVGSIADLRTGGRWFNPRLGQNSWIDDSHSDRIHSSLTAVHCFDNDYVGNQPVAWKEYCAEHWLKELQGRMDRCTGHHNITEILFKMALNTIQSIINIFATPEQGTKPTTSRSQVLHATD